MPRISAETVKEHVARQEQAVVDAAIRLFTRDGVAEVAMADIAAEVGLARNSLYRYFPDKSHILAAWFRAVIDPLIVESHTIAASRKPVVQRLDEWVGLQLDHLITPEHQAMVAASGELAGLSGNVAAEIGERHRELYSSLGLIVGELLGESGRRDGDLGSHDARVVSMFVVGLIRSAATMINAGDADPASVRSELLGAARAVVGREASPDGE